MTDEMFAKLKRSLIAHEDYKKLPYVDTLGKITIGIGYNLSDRGLSDDWINNQFQEDVNYFYDQLTSTFAWYQHLTTDRQIVLIDMAFIGWKKFLTFNKMLDALSRGDYTLASKEMLDSKWAEQVKSRATDLAHGMLTGVYQV
jgi:lysozyme